VAYWKDNFRVHVSLGCAETLVRRGGIINHHSIAYSLSNISAKNYLNRLMWVESIVCNISVVFLRRSVIYCCKATSALVIAQLYFSWRVSVILVSVCPVLLKWFTMLYCVVELSSRSNDLTIVSLFSTVYFFQDGNIVAPCQAEVVNSYETAMECLRKGEGWFSAVCCVSYQ